MRQTNPINQQQPSSTTPGCACNDGANNNASNEKSSKHLLRIKHAHVRHFSIFHQQNAHFGIGAAAAATVRKSFFNPLKKKCNIIAFACFILNQTLFYLRTTHNARRLHTSMVMVFLLLFCLIILLLQKCLVWWSDSVRSSHVHWLRLWINEHVHVVHLNESRWQRNYEHTNHIMKCSRDV